MLSAMNPERTRHERYIEYTAALREGFVSGLLSELQPLNQWVVWKGELENGKRKKVPYNPNYHLTRASVKLPKGWGSLDQALHAHETGNYTGLGVMITPPFVMVDLDHSDDRATGTITDPQAAQIIQTLHSSYRSQCGKMSKREEDFFLVSMLYFSGGAARLLNDQMTRAIYLMLREEHHHQF